MNSKNYVMNIINTSAFRKFTNQTKITLNDYHHMNNVNTFLRISISLTYAYIKTSTLKNNLLKRYCDVDDLQRELVIYFQDICRNKTFNKACRAFNQINSYNINYFLVMKYDDFMVKTYKQIATTKHKISTSHRLDCHFIKNNILHIFGHHKKNPMNHPCSIAAVFAILMVQIQEPYILIDTVSLLFWSPTTIIKNIASKDTIKPTKADMIKQEILTVIYEHEFDRAMKKVKCLYNCYRFHKYKTKVAGQVGSEVWEKGEEITLDELLYIKLFNDYDKIKRKCSQLWHFNYKLLTIISKFGEHIFGTNDNHDNMQLYLNASSQNMVIPREKSLFIPLSTFGCNEMAQILAEEGETIMKIRPVFQNSYCCRAFDASKISDDPDQQEYIIMYVHASIVDISTWRISVAENKLY